MSYASTMAVAGIKIYTEAEPVAMVTVKGLSETVFQKYNLNLLNKISCLYAVKQSLILRDQGCSRIVLKRTCEPKRENVAWKVNKLHSKHCLGLFLLRV